MPWDREISCWYPNIEFCTGFTAVQFHWLQWYYSWFSNTCLPASSVLHSELPTNTKIWHSHTWWETLGQLHHPRRHHSMFIALQKTDLWLFSVVAACLICLGVSRIAAPELWRKQGVHYTYPQGAVHCRRGQRLWLHVHLPSKSRSAKFSSHKSHTKDSELKPAKDPK